MADKRFQFGKQLSYSDLDRRRPRHEELRSQDQLQSRGVRHSLPPLAYIEADIEREKDLPLVVHPTKDHAPYRAFRPFTEKRSEYDPDMRPLRELNEEGEEKPVPRDVGTEGELGPVDSWADTRRFFTADEANEALRSAYDDDDEWKALLPE